MASGNYTDGNGTRRNRHGDSVVMSEEDRAEMNRLNMNGEQWLAYCEQRRQKAAAIHADIEAEKGVLSVLIRAPQLLPQAAEQEGLKPRHFYDDAHRELYRVVTDMAGSGKPVDSITLISELGKRQIGDALALDAVGGSAYVFSLMRMEAMESNIGWYASEIVEQAERRRQESFAVQLVEQIQRRLPSEIVAEQICHFAESEREKQTKKAGPLTMKDLRKAHTDLRPVVIEGLAREGEVVNVIAAPKMGKSWLVTGLALAVCTGRWWLQTFRTVKGKVLIIDNELHPETSAHRIPKVAEALGLADEDYQDDLLIENMRGSLRDINWRSQISIATGRWGFLEENFGWGPKAEARAGTVV